MNYFGIKWLRDLVWGPWMLCFLLGTGVYLNVLLRGLPIRKLFRSVRMATCRDGAEFETKEQGQSGISSFACLATELAATIGTGNITGVVLAMTMGGPGALVWMMLSALVGLATKLTESTLSVKYRAKDISGLPIGGPMITLSRAFPLPWIGKFLAGCYAFFATLTSFGMGNAIQANSIASSVRAVFGHDVKTTAGILFILTLFSVFGGMKRISKISTCLVPAMGTIYVASCLGMVLLWPQNLLPGLCSILISAFSPRAASGGLFGLVTASWIKSLNCGISCGVFSNEAGLGAGGISAAATNVSDPVEQGWISMSGVFFDTLVICFLTGIAYACSGVGAMACSGNLRLKSGVTVDPLNGTDLMIAAFEKAYGRYGGAMLCFCMCLFAFATILGWAVQGETAFRYLFGENGRLAYRLLYAAVTWFGACLGTSVIWNVSDLANGLLAIPNLISLWVLGSETCKDILEWERKPHHF